MAITGGCLCGAVRYSVAVEKPIATRICWCRDCQYFAAGNGTVNVIFPTSAVQVTGPLRAYLSTADSGNHMVRQFCEKCGTPVTSVAKERAHLTILRAGTLDDREVARPLLTIWSESAPTWALLSDTLPKIARQPPPAA